MTVARALPEVILGGISPLPIPPMSDRSFSNLVRSPLAWFVFIAMVAVSGLITWQGEREKARELYERERVAAEQAEQRRVTEAEEQRARERQRLVDEIRAQKEAEEQQRQIAMEIRKEETLNKQFVADERYVTPQQAAFQSYQMRQDQWRGQVEQYRQRFEDERNLQQARADVERQKRYLQQREYEEQIARLRRDSKARYGN